MTNERLEKSKIGKIEPFNDNETEEREEAKEEEYDYFLQSKENDENQN